MVIIEFSYENDDNVITLKEKLECAVKHHFGRHDSCPTNSKCKHLSGREVVTDIVFENIMSITTTSLLCYSSSLIENCDTNQVESFNNKQAEVTDGKRVNFSQSWSWIYRLAFSVLAWNSSDQDAVAMYLELAKNEEISDLHRSFNDRRAKKRFIGEDYQRPDHATSIREYLRADSIDPISYDPQFQHPYATGKLSTENLANQKGPSYSSFGNNDRDELTRTELFKERDRVLRFLVRAHAERKSVATRTASRHDSEEYVNIRSKVITSDKISIICKFVGGSKAARTASWPNKLYNVLGSGGVRYSDRFIMEQLMREKALTWLENYFQKKIIRIGTMLHPTYPFLEGNPAGLLDDKHTVETFYLFEQKSLTVIDAAKCVKWLNITSDQKLSICQKSDEYSKIQGNMAASNRDSCVIIVLTDTDQVNFEVLFDVSYWEERLPILMDFFYYGLVEQADPMKNRSLPCRDYSSISSLCESQEWRTWP